ncbi:MAG: MBL fold metallo-hydrolase [Clostridium sp.]|nr:MBL fold metallo-hydrolase [Clostridium sp.]
MAKRSRRSVRQLEDLPGLFDKIDLEYQAPDPYKEIVDQHRRAQASAHGISLEMEDGVIKAKRILQYISFGSGSSGNCAYIGVSGEGGVLIDAGVEEKTVVEGLKANCIPIDKIAGIIITHDHTDHVRSAYQLLRKNPQMRIFCTPRILQGILRRHSISKRIKDYHTSVFKEFVFDAGPFKITPFETSHDGTDNVGYFINVADSNFVVATDMGKITDRADHYMRMANFLMIEANYDAQMLATGKYPDYLKARIRSDYGHLDNMVTAKYLQDIWGKALTDIYLCHLSDDNNRPDVAIRAVKAALEEKGVKVGDASGSVEDRNADVHISALPRYDASPLFIHRV